MFLLQ